MWGPRNLEVTQPHHVQHAIVSVIFRQTEMFTKEDIYERVEKNLENSDFGKDGARRTEVDVKKMVDETLNILWVNECVSYDSKQKKYKLTMSWPAIY